MMDEANKHGRCLNVVIPRPRPDGVDEPYTGKVVIEFEDANVAMRARNALHGRKFGGKEVEATFLPEHLYSQGQYVR
jgi:splicing factor U2AF 65 kDa subunit